MKILFALFCLSLNTQASFLIEPYAGFNFNGGWSEDDSNSTNQFSGTMYGARAGVQNMGFMFGVDGRKGEWEIDNNSSTELSYNHFALFAGYDFPIFLRVFASYIIGGNATDDDDNEYLQPSGYTLGVGYKLFPYLSANAEYGTINFKERENALGTNTSTDERASYLLFSVSVPFNIGI